MACLAVVVVLIATTTTGSAEVDIITHSEGGLVGGHWEFNVTILGNISKVQMSVDGDSPLELERRGPGSYGTILDTRAYTEGAHIITVEAYDEDGASDKVMLEIDIDNTPPELEVEWPKETIMVHPFDVKANFNDTHPDSVVAWIELMNDEEVTMPLARTNTSLSGRVDIMDLLNGTNQLRVVITDGAGNVNASDIHIIEVRKLPDLYLEEMIFDNIEPQMVQGIYDILYTIRNIGYSETGPFDIVLEVDGEIAITRTIDGTLGVNETVKGWVEWSPSENRAYNLSIVVDPENRIDELIETNNARMDRQSFSDEGACLASYMAAIVPLVSCIVLLDRRKKGDRTTSIETRTI